MVESLIIFYMVVVGLWSSGITSPKWYVWLFPVLFSLAKAVSIFIVRLSKSNPAIGLVLGIAWTVFIVRLII